MTETQIQQDHPFADLSDEELLARYATASSKQKKLDRTPSMAPMLGAMNAVHTNRLGAEVNRRGLA